MNRSIIIVDDHLLFAKSLKIMVDSFKGYSVIEIFSNGQELVNYFEKEGETPDIIILDFKMPVLNGLETMSWIKKKKPKQKVVALSMEDDEATVLAMIRLGVKGYLLKDIDPDEFHYALEALMKEGYYHSDLQIRTLLNEKEGSVDGLNKMETEFIQLACTELTYREIAERMDRSYKTIDGYRENLFRKLSVRSRTGLAMYAIKHNLVNI